MKKIDPSELAARYAEMSDEGLAELLAEGKDSFEAIAWSVLSAEASRRGIPEPPVFVSDRPRSKVQGEAESEEEVFSTNDPIEADVVRGVLKADGIEVRSTGETRILPHPLLRSQTEGIKLIVRKSEYERARSIIEEHRASPETPLDGSSES